ncbi:hypothetical protein COT97_02585 [Candidatus Falkowbacteria bacterium CG10_big_fil_rev_8_21_14_0_10_39_11]|uniref:Helicase n=1 Tax=Candidatus Falkowbacteria bacterium CG10_big_fil_rev_8_21_14_0_10_39_11 TaxID=1974565 RepID=A0A2H0V536_9BACT|nr:MAG: hypothetical protein COT97_02585 [Candidatus Falkowbacteria bacterium CG10_big_fil_rev_8_21_14_0_10_39_11]
MSLIQTLPIADSRNFFVDTVHENQVTILEGPTGSGKTILAPLFLHLAGLTNHGGIGVTEPRRVAATSTAKFVHKEFGHLAKIGYQVRHDHIRSGDEDIIYMTTGIMLRELLADPDLKKYKLIFVDEAHERSLDSDILLGCIKKIIARDPELKVVVASATIDTQKFSDYFDGAPIVKVAGFNFPVATHFSPRDYDFNQRKIRDIHGQVIIAPPEYVEAIVRRVQYLCDSRPDGDIMIFVPGVKEINWVIDEIKKKKIHGLRFFPLHGSMNIEKQNECLDQISERRVIVSTNVGETSVTPDGIVAVIDSGLVKQTELVPTFSGHLVSSLQVVPHSQSGCKQRLGRTGRVCPGEYFALYTEDSFHSRPVYTEPEIHRSSLENVLLHLISIGEKDIEEFPFLDPPDHQRVLDTLELLLELGAIDQNRNLTDLGRQMALLPLEPRIAKLVLTAEKYDCLMEATILAGFLSSGRQVYVYAKEDARPKAEAAWRLVQDQRSDFMTYLKIFRLWDRQPNEATQKLWCREHFLHHRALFEVDQISDQICDFLADIGINVPIPEEGQDIVSGLDADTIHKCVLAAFAQNAMEASGPKDYKHPKTGSVRRHKGSVMHDSPERFLMAAKIEKKGHAREYEEQQTYMDHVGPYKLEWIDEVAPHLSRPDVNLDEIKIDTESFQFTVTVRYRFNQIIPVGIDDKIINLSDLLPYLKRDQIENLALATRSILISWIESQYKSVGGWNWGADYYKKAVLIFTLCFRQLFRHEDYNPFNAEHNRSLIVACVVATAEQLKIEYAEVYEERKRQAERLAEQETEKLIKIQAGQEKARALLTPEIISLLDSNLPSYRDRDDWQTLKRYTLGEIDEITKYGINYLMEETLEKSASTVSRLTSIARSHQVLDQQKKTHQDLLNQHLRDWYFMCPVCEHEFNQVKLHTGQTPCQCESNEFEEPYRARGEDHIVILRSTLGDQMIAELVADCTDSTIKIQLNTTKAIVLTDKDQLDQVDLEEFAPPTEEQLYRYRHTDEIAAYEKEKARAERQVDKQKAKKLSFSQVRTARGHEWHSRNGNSTIYVVKPDSELQPSADETDFYCETAKGAFATFQGKNFIHATPFLPVKSY